MGVRDIILILGQQLSCVYITNLMEIGFILYFVIEVSFIRLPNNILLIPEAITSINFYLFKAL